MHFQGLSTCIVDEYTRQGYRNSNFLEQIVHKICTQASQKMAQPRLNGHIFASVGKFQRGKLASGNMIENLELQIFEYYK